MGYLHGASKVRSPVTTVLGWALRAMERRGKIGRLGDEWDVGGQLRGQREKEAPGPALRSHSPGGEANQ